MKITFNVNLQLSVDECLLRLAGCQVESLRSIACSLASIATDVHLIRLKYNPISSDVADISVTQKGETPMASKFKVSVLKKAAGMAKARAATKTATPHLGSSFVITDGGQGVFQTMGLDSENPPVPVDISALATQTVVSADPNLTVVVDGMTATITAAAGGAAGVGQVTWTVTANDGSFTFSFVGDVSYSGGAVSGIVVTQVS